MARHSVKYAHGGICDSLSAHTRTPEAAVNWCWVTIMYYPLLERFVVCHCPSLAAILFVTATQSCYSKEERCVLAIGTVPNKKGDDVD